jgi:hypothetical protein
MSFRFWPAAALSAIQVKKPPESSTLRVNQHCAKEGAPAQQ